MKYTGGELTGKFWKENWQCYIKNVETHEKEETHEEVEKKVDINSSSIEKVPNNDFQI